MSFASLASAYFSANLLLVCGLVFAYLLTAVNKRTSAAISNRFLLRFQYIVFTTILLFTVIGPLIPQKRLLPPLAKI